MSPKTILAILPTPPIAERMLGYTTALAAGHGAHLMGICISAEPPLNAGFAVEIPTDLVERQRAARRQEAEITRALFEKATAEAGCSASWRQGETTFAGLARELITTAMGADLVVMTRDAGASVDTVTDLVARVVLESGRPAVVLPSETVVPKPIRKVTVAWNASREAARAAFELPGFIAPGGQVDVLVVDADAPLGSHAPQPGDDIAAALGRHGLDANVVRVTTSGRSVGEEILAHVSTSDSDLLVMGCYGHAQWREAIFGGATRSVLQGLSTPVLLTH